MGKKKTTEQYKQELEEYNSKYSANIKLKTGVEYNGANTKILHICTCGKEWLVTPSGIINSDSKSSCGLCYTFAEWGIDNLGENFLEEYWDYDKNGELGIDPWKISYGSNKYVYIYCKKTDYHGSYKIKCPDFIHGSRCSYCKGDYLVHPKDSFGQFLIDSFGDNALELYWDYNKNKIDPFKYTRHTNRKVWIYCQEKDYHGSYDILCGEFVNGGRCGYCKGSVKVHERDSLGYLYPKSLRVWSDKNEKSPYEYTPYSNKYIWHKCLSFKHEDHYGAVSNVCISDFRCPDCVREQKDSIMATTLKQVLKREYGHTIWEYDAGFKVHNHISRYDIYVPELNLLIECQSEYHDSEEQIEIDRLKKQFALDNGYEYIAIDKRDFSIEEILHFFIPHIETIPDYVEINKNTSRNWDTDDAQKLLDNGYTYREVASLLETTYGSIHGAIEKKILKRPVDYQKEGKRIVCLSKDNEFIKEYRTVSEAANELANGNNSSISRCLTNYRKTAYGFKWMYLVDYDNIVKNELVHPP